MSKKYLLFICSTIYICFINASAHTSGEVEEICPLDGTKFKAIIDMSGTKFGQQLDLKDIGPIAAPWRIPVCPTDHFVIYKKDFTDKEKTVLKSYIDSDEYQSLVADNSTYFLLAKIFEYLKKDSIDIAYTYLQASWEVDNKPEKYSQYATLSLEKFKLFISTNDKDHKSWKVAHMVAGELERRLKYFDEAKQRFLSLKILFESDADPKWLKIINYQLELIEQQDSQPHISPTTKRRPNKIEHKESKQ